MVTTKANNGASNVMDTKEVLLLDSIVIADDFPVLHKFGILIEKYWLSGILWDVMKLNKLVTNTNILTFRHYNDSMSMLIQVPSSASMYRFGRNIHTNKWLDWLLLAASSASSSLDAKSKASDWLITYLGTNYNDEFVNVASKLGLLLAPKIMDAETPCAIWKEANCTVSQQCIILHHLSLFFGRCITVPESQLQELEKGALPPITGCTIINNEKIHYWYKPIGAVLIH